MSVDTMRVPALGPAVAGALFAMLLTACYQPPPVMYEASNPAVMQGCPDGAPGEDLVTRSYAAMLKGFSELKWRFDHILPQEGALVATACYGNGLECMTMVFSVEENGRISATRSPTQKIDHRMDMRMFGWLRLFEQKFSLYRCMSMDLAVQELKKFGAVQESPSAAPAAP
jgi:hypothetical protein